MLTPRKQNKTKSVAEPETIVDILEIERQTARPSKFDAIQKYAWVVSIIFSAGALGFSAYNLKLASQNREALASATPFQQATTVDIKKFMADLPQVPPALGDPNAKQTIYEFGDYQCPFCKLFFDERFAQIKKDYIDTGKAKFVFINLPFLGQESKDAAEAAWCAADQNQFWAYHDQLYQNQKSENSGGFTAATLSSFAGKLNLDQGKFDKCLSSNQHQKQIDAEAVIAKKYGAGSTPTFFIGNQVIIGAQPIEIFQKALAN